jgi:hypothetical protein
MSSRLQSIPDSAAAIVHQLMPKAISSHHPGPLISLIWSPYLSGERPFHASYGDGGLGFLVRRETNVPQSTFVTDPGSDASSASAILPTFGLMDGQ